MGNLKRRSTWVDYALILIGTGLMAFAIKSIFDPINLVTGGFTGLAIIIKSLSGVVMGEGIPLWLTNLILNVPFFLLAIHIKGRHFLSRTVVATFLLSGWLYLLPQVSIISNDFILASIFGGAITGVGMGFVFLAKATTGGTDMVAVLIQKYIRHYTVAQIMQILDALVVLIGVFLFGINAALYAIIAIFTISKITDSIMEGLKFSKAAYIITEKHEEVSQAIMQELDRGVTGLMARGMYSGLDKCMLFCVVSKKEIVNVKDIVMQIDKDAFVIVSDAREVLGEGFLEDHQEKIKKK